MVYITKGHSPGRAWHYDLPYCRKLNLAQVQQAAGLLGFRFPKWDEVGRMEAETRVEVAKVEKLAQRWKEEGGGWAVGSWGRREGGLDDDAACPQARAAGRCLSVHTLQSFVFGGV